MILQEGVRMKVDANSQIRICDRHFLGHEYRYRLSTPDGATLYVRSPINESLAIGTRIQVSVDPSAVRIFPGY
jgi:iron(III) transport system ATP-binding protein